MEGKNECKQRRDKEICVLEKNISQGELNTA